MNPDYHHSRPGDDQHFCSRCAEKIEHIIPAGDSRLRTVCPACRTIHYRRRWIAPDSLLRRRVPRILRQQGRARSPRCGKLEGLGRRQGVDLQDSSGHHVPRRLEAHG
ncbi:MAG: hypothetical protein EBZ55_04740 [Actinobacteria bacterium]|nr:hypothetical protein [Actinomycetota bacterium]